MFAFLLAASLGFAADSTALASPVLATVNGHAITQADFEAATAGFAPDDVERAGKDALVEQLVVQELLVEAARASKVGESSLAQARLREAERNTLALLELERVVAERTTDAAIGTWYAEHSAQYATDEAHAHHMLLDTEAAASAALSRVRAGEAFATVASELSTDRGSAESGGDLGWFQRRHMVDEFGDAVYGTKPGELAGPVRSKFGWHVIYVEAFRDHTPVSEAREEIAAALKGEIIEAYLTELRANAKVTLAEPKPVATLVPLPGAVGIPEDAPRMGKGRQVTVVVFTDLQCPFCAVAHETFNRLVASRPDLAVVYRHYPISQGCNPNVGSSRHEHACEAAAAIVCSGKKGAAVLDELFANQDAIDGALIRRVALAHGGSARKLDACLAAPATAARIAQDTAEATRLGLEGTPTIYVGKGNTWYKLDGHPAELGEALKNAGI